MSSPPLLPPTQTCKMWWRKVFVWYHEMKTRDISWVFWFFSEVSSPHACQLNYIFNCIRVYFFKSIFGFLKLWCHLDLRSAQQLNTLIPHTSYLLVLQEYDIFCILRLHNAPLMENAPLIFHWMALNFISQSHHSFQGPVFDFWFENWEIKVTEANTENSVFN